MGRFFMAVKIFYFCPQMLKIKGILGKFGKGIFSLYLCDKKIMKIDLTLLEIVAKISRNWNEYRDDFVNFARPSWIEMGGEELANHMVSQYINRNDGGCVLEEFWRLDIHQREILIKWLLSKERGCYVEFFECTK